MYNTLLLQLIYDILSFQVSQMRSTIPATLLYVSKCMITLSEILWIIILQHLID